LDHGEPVIEQGKDYAGLRLLGGRLCLDFTNTVHRRYPTMGDSFINSYTDLVNWSVFAGVLDESEAITLRRVAVSQPDEASRTYEQALNLRESIYRLFSAIANGRTPDELDLAMLNDALANGLGNLELARDGDHFHWQWAGNPQALDRMLWAVARSAADLLTSDLLRRVRECPDPDGCGWLFVDTSKNRSRRWCSMEGCGNVAKARRHYQRQRQARKEE
jgi:predicted RNA-binding Zn ribbon-like protein